MGAAGAEAQRAKAREVRTWTEVPESQCPVCEGAFADLPKWVACAVAAASPYEFATFQVGTKFPGPCEGLEREVAAAMGQEKVGESLRTEANRLLAPALAAATGAKAIPEGRPDLVLSVDTRYWSCDVEANPVYVKGRYNKLRRDLPQTHWPCRRCEGKGCWECNDTGVTYSESVEDAIGIPAEPLFGGSGYSFHGAGREDIDALMLGTGRPFILEVQHPRRRSADLEDLARTINAETERSGVAVRDLRMAAKEEVAEIKEGEYQKLYVAHCLAEQPLAPDVLADVCARLTGAVLDQRTPDRVSHRRADLVRKRTLYAVRPVDVALGAPPTTRFAIEVHAESGTYIKEMVSGDEGRTTPSFSALANVPVKVEFLDVVAILDHLPKATAAPTPSAATATA